MNYINNRIKAFGYALKGIYSFFSEEAHPKLHLMAFIFVIAAGFYFDITRVEWFMILTVSALVFALEMVNSTIERTIDHIHPEHHKSIGKAKDIAAGAVLIAAIVSLVVGGMVFLPYLLGKF